MALKKVRKPKTVTVLQSFHNQTVLAIAAEMVIMREVVERTHTLFAALAKASGLDIDT